MKENKITALTFDDLRPLEGFSKSKDSFPDRNKREFKVRKTKSKSLKKEERYSLEEFNNLLSGLNGKSRISSSPFIAKKSRS